MLGGRLGLMAADVRIRGMIMMRMVIVIVIVMMCGGRLMDLIEHVEVAGVVVDEVVPVRVPLVDDLGGQDGLLGQLVEGDEHVVQLLDHVLGEVLDGLEARVGEVDGPRRR